MRVATMCVVAAVAVVLAVAGTGKAASVSIGDIEGHVGVADVSTYVSFRDEFTAHGPGADTHEISVIAGTGGPIESSLSYAFDDSPPGLLGDFQVETTISVDEGTHSAGSAVAAQFARSIHAFHPACHRLCCQLQRPPQRRTDGLDESVRRSAIRHGDWRQHPGRGFGGTRRTGRGRTPVRLQHA